MKARTLALIAAGLAAAAVPVASFAGGSNVGFSIAIGGPAYYPPPPVVYYPPPPVLYYPPPVAYYPRPYYYAPPTVVFRAGTVWGGHPHGNWGRGQWGHGKGGRGGWH